MTPVHLGMGHYGKRNEYKPSLDGKKSLWGKKPRGSKKTTVRALNKFKDWDWNYCKVTFSSDMTKLGLSWHKKSQTLAYLLKYDHWTGGWSEAFIPPTPERNGSIRQESWMSSLPISRIALSQTTTTTNTPFSAWSWAVQYQTYSKTHSYIWFLNGTELCSLSPLHPYHFIGVNTKTWRWFTQWQQRVGWFSPVTKSMQYD